MNKPDKERKGDANRDPLTCEPGSHPVGTGIGTAAGGVAGAAAAGAVAGAAGGPVGAAVGLAVGAAIGAAAGHAGGEALNPTASPSLGRFIDYDVIDRDGNSVGTIDAVWQDHLAEPAYLAVRTGWLGLGKAHVVPAYAAQVNDARKRIKLPFTADQIKNAPSFDCTVDLDGEKESTVATYYGKYGFRRPEIAAVKREAPAAGTHRGDVHAHGTHAEEARMQLKEEEVKIGKREVEYGGVRLRKIIRTETVTKPVELKREEIVVERVPASEASRAAGGADLSEKEIYIPLRREEAVVAKETHVKEEVRVGKRTEKEQKVVSETARKEDLEIEKEGMPDSRLKETGDRPKVAPYQPKERSRK